MKSIFAVVTLLSVAAFADDKVKEVQAELKSQGFFYGNVDGKDGPETTAAIRRFEIRNGLPVTGTLNPQTLEALGVEAGSAASDKPVKTPPAPPVPATPPSPKPSDQVNPPPPGEAPVVPKARDVVRPVPSTPPAPPAPPIAERRPAVADIPPTAPSATVRRPVPNPDLAVVPPPRGIPPAVDDEYTTLYFGTPYATAPKEVQISILRSAQDHLIRRRYYRGLPDGIPGPATSEALFLYQEQRRINRTGRLDLQTLADLNLLPGKDPEAPPLKPFYNPNRKRDRSVETPRY